MAAQNDPFGQALGNFLAGRPGPILELETDAHLVIPAMAAEWFFQEPGAWHDFERDALTDPALKGPVLDLGAGAGRASVLLESRGLEVTAVDSSPGAVAVCEARGLADVRLGDLRQPPADKNWGAVLMLCGNLGLGGDFDSCRRLLKQLARIVRDDAVLIGDTVDPTVGQTEDSDYTAYMNAQVAAGRYRGRVGLRLRYGDEVGEWWEQSNILVADVPRLVRGTGWKVETHHVEGMDHYVKLRRTGPLPD